MVGAMRRAISLGIRTSVRSGACGPCCSVAPVGTMTVWCDLRNVSTSTLVISPRNTVDGFMVRNTARTTNIRQPWGSATLLLVLLRRGRLRRLGGDRGGGHRRAFGLVVHGHHRADLDRALLLGRRVEREGHLLRLAAGLGDD